MCDLTIGHRLLRPTHGLLALALAVTCACRVSESDERELGAYQAAYIDSAVAMINDTATARYIATLGRTMTSRTSRAELDWRYQVVNASLLNAMALPGGFVYVTRGLIEQSGREDELAGVMGHEIAHVVLRHSVKQIEQSGKRELAEVMLCTLTRVCTSLGGVVAVQVAEDAATAQYSQHDEAEADSLAVVIAIRAGIDPEGLPAFLRKMLEQRTEQPTPVDAFFASHPTDEARIAALRRQIAALGPSVGRELVQDTPEFHAVQDRLRALPPAPPLPQEQEAAGTRAR